MMVTMVTMAMMAPVRAEVSRSKKAITPWVIAIVTDPRIVTRRAAVRLAGSQHRVHDGVTHAGGFKMFHGFDVQIVNRPTGPEISKDDLIGNSLF